MTRDFFERGKMQVSHSLEVLGSQTGIPKGLEKNRKFCWEGVFNNSGIQRALGVDHFGISEGWWGGGGLKCSSRPW